jgi:hypothetical protein
MPVDFLSDDQVSRYGRFAAEPTLCELEQFFRLDARARELALARRRDVTRLGWAVQGAPCGCSARSCWTTRPGCRRRPSRSSPSSLGVVLEVLAEYAVRPKTAYEHSREIREAYGYREFSAAEQAVCAFLAARVWASVEGPRTLFDRAVEVLLDTAPAAVDGEAVSVLDAWEAIEKVVPRAKLAEALATIAQCVPDGDEDAEWRAALASRYGTVRGFIRLLVDAVDFGAATAGAPVLKALKQLPHMVGRRKVAVSEVDQTLVTGSWRRLVFANPGVEPGCVEKCGANTVAGLVVPSARGSR